MKHVTVLIFFTFSSVVCSGEANFTSESQLTKNNPYKQNYSRQYIVYFLRGTEKVSFMYGFGVVVHNGQILVHKNVLKYSDLQIYFPYNAKRVCFKSVKIFGEVHLLMPNYESVSMVMTMPPSTKVYSDEIPLCTKTRTLIWKRAELIGRIVNVARDEKEGMFLMKNGYIIVTEKPNDIDAIGDPLFIEDLLVGFLIEKTNNYNEAKYQDLDHYQKYLIRNN